MKSKSRIVAAAAAAAAALALAITPSLTAAADTQPQVVYQLPSGTPCLKGFGNCVIYIKSAQLSSGRIVAAFEKATVQTYPSPDTAGGAKGEPIPIYKTDDNGTSWQKLADVPPPSSYGDPAMAKYSSNWTNPFLYVMPQTVGSLTAGTLMLATVVSGEDEWYREHKLADPNYVPDNDGDRRDLAIALYSSTDQGASWTFRNIIATGGWQGGSAGAPGRYSNANTYHQQDPVWEPYLMVYNNQLVAYYSDENDYTGYNSTTGVPTLATDNATGTDDGAQILVHKTWDGSSSSWSQPVVDVSGDTFSFNGGTRIGGGRPGMTTVVPTTDGKWMMTFEYFGGGDNTRYKIANNPLQFFASGGPNGTGVTSLPVASGSSPLTNGGSPVIVRLPDGRIMFNANGNSAIWTNDGSSTGAWTQKDTSFGAAYSRQMQYVSGLNQVMILGNAGPSTLKWALWTPPGSSTSANQTITNRNSGLLLDVYQASTADGATVTQWASNGGTNQKWQVQSLVGGYSQIVSTNSGKCLDVYQANTADGADVVQWTCNGGTNQQWQLQDSGNGYVTLVNRNSGKCLDVNAFSTANGGRVQQWTCTGGTNQQWARAAA